MGNVELRIKMVKDEGRNDECVELIIQIYREPSSLQAARRKMVKDMWLEDRCLRENQCTVWSKGMHVPGGARFHWY